MSSRFIKEVAGDGAKFLPSKTKGSGVKIYCGTPGDMDLIFQCSQRDMYRKYGWPAKPGMQKAACSRMRGIAHTLQTLYLACPDQASSLPGSRSRSCTGVQHPTGYRTHKMSFPLGVQTTPPSGGSQRGADPFRGSCPTWTIAREKRHPGSKCKRA